MGYIEQENCVRLCNDLARMLEEEKTVLSGFLSGDIAEEYKKLLDSEIEEWPNSPVFPKPLRASKI